MKHSEPKIVVLAAQWPTRVAPWEATDEVGYATRMIAGAVAATGARVHVVTHHDGPPSTQPDGAFIVHRIEGPSPAHIHEARLMLDLLSRARGARRTRSEASNHPYLCPDDAQRARRWFGQRLGSWPAQVISDLEPDLVLLCGHLHVGATESLASRGGPWVHIPLLEEGARVGAVLEVLDPIGSGSWAVLGTSHAETDLAIAMGAVEPRPAEIGGYIHTNPDVLAEPSSSGDHDYLFVRCPFPARSETYPAGLARLVEQALGKEGKALTVAFADELHLWRSGHVQRLEPLGRRIDLWRRIAWARATLDLSPGKLLGAETLVSMLYGTPVVVPSGSRARQHVESGNAGLWFSDAHQLIAQAALLMDNEDIASTLGAQAKRWAEPRWGSASRLVEAIRSALSPFLSRW